MVMTREKRTYVDDTHIQTSTPIHLQTFQIPRVNKLLLNPCGTPLFHSTCAFVHLLRHPLGLSVAGARLPPQLHPALVTLGLGLETRSLHIRTIRQLKIARRRC